jgi:tetratricopeptide (TPR) repeat protein
MELPSRARYIVGMTSSHESVAASDPQLLAGTLERLFGGESLAEIDNVPQERLDAIYTESCDLVDREDFEGALDLLVYLVMANPYDFRYQFGYALCLQHFGHFADAAKHYGLAWVLDSNDAGCAFRLGECLEALGERDDAIEAFETAIALCVPPNPTSEVRVFAEAAVQRLRA